MGGQGKGELRYLERARRRGQQRTATHLPTYFSTTRKTTGAFPWLRVGRGRGRGRGRIFFSIQKQWRLMWLHELTDRDGQANMCGAETGGGEMRPATLISSGRSLGVGWGAWWQCGVGNHPQSKRRDEVIFFFFEKVPACSKPKDYNTHTQNSPETTRKDRCPGQLAQRTSKERKIQQIPWRSVCLTPATPSSGLHRRRSKRRRGRRGGTKLL